MILYNFNTIFSLLIMLLKFLCCEFLIKKKKHDEDIECTKENPQFVPIVIAAIMSLWKPAQSISGTLMSTEGKKLAPFSVLHGRILHGFYLFSFSEVLCSFKDLERVGLRGK